MALGDGDVALLLSQEIAHELAESERRAKIRMAPRTPFLDWSLRLPEPKTGTLNFDRWPFQRALYSDELAECEEAVVMKSSQVGVSAWLLRFLLYWPDTRGLTGMYVFPRLKQMLDQSDARVRPVILNSEYLRARVPFGSVQNKGLKAVGPGMCYFRGSESILDLESVDADSLGLDEYDHLLNTDIAEERTAGSVHPRTRRVGNPTIPGWGVAKLYEESDQRRWTVKCERCGEWQELDFWRNVDQQRVARVCSDCHKGELDVRVGEWVATFPDRDIPGFHITRLSVPHLNLRRLIDNSRKRSPKAIQSFYNRGLGLPYAPKEGRLTLEAIQACMRPDVHLLEGKPSNGNLRTMGVDVASVRALNVRISEHLNDREKVAVFIGLVDSYDEVAALIERFAVNMTAIDHLPEGRLAMGVAERFPGRVFLVSQAGQGQADVLKVDPERNHVSVRRVELFDATTDQIRSQRNLLPENLPEGYAAEMQAMQRVIEEDDEGRKTVRWLNTGPDDWAQAEAYDVVATELFFWRQLADSESREDLRPLEEMMEFERADFNGDPMEAEYRAGPTDEYRPGPGER